MESFIYYAVFIVAMFGSACILYLFSFSIFGMSFLSQGHGTEKSSEKAHKRGAYAAATFLIICASFAFFSYNAEADCDEIYLKVGTGYKFDEQNKAVLEGVEYEYTNVSPYSARIETGVECGNLTYGISHHSQWATGFPFNETGEYYKTEIFLDYKFSWGI